MQLSLKYFRIVLLNSLLIIIDKVFGVWVAVALLHGRINAKKRKFWGANLGKSGQWGHVPPNSKRSILTDSFVTVFVRLTSRKCVFISPGYWTFEIPLCVFRPEPQ